MSVESFSGTPKYHFTFTSDETFASRYRISGVNSSAGVCVYPSMRDFGQRCCVCLGCVARAHTVRERDGGGTYRVVRVDLLLLDRLAVVEALDHPRLLLRVSTDTDVYAPRAVGDEGHEVEELGMEVRAA